MLEHNKDINVFHTEFPFCRNNPFAKAVENRATEIERLQTENDALRERVRLLEEGEMHDITQKVGMKVNTDGPSPKEITGMGCWCHVGFFVGAWYML